MTMKRRIETLEARQFWRELKEAATPYGLHAADLLDEARRFFAMPLTAQLEEIDDLTDRFSEAELHHIREVLTRHYQP